MKKNLKPAWKQAFNAPLDIFMKPENLSSPAYFRFAARDNALTFENIGFTDNICFSRHIGQIPFGVVSWN